MFWSSYNAFHRCGSLRVTGNGQRQLGPLCATWRIALPPPTTTHLLPKHPHAQTHAHTVVAEGCSLEAETAKTGSWCGYINSPRTAQHVLFWCNYGAGRAWFSKERSWATVVGSLTRDLVRKMVAPGWAWCGLEYGGKKRKEKTET